MNDKASAKGAFAPYDTQDVLPINVPTGLFSFLILYGGMTVLAGVVAVPLVARRMKPSRRQDTVQQPNPVEVP